MAEPGQLRILIRVDAGGSTGVGHAMRCSTLGEALCRNGHRVQVLTEHLPGWITDRMSALGIEVLWLNRADESLAVILQRGPHAPDLVVIDGYLLGDELRSLASLSIPVVVIDDNHELPVSCADLVVNQNLHAGPHLYPDVELGTRLLLGPKYALIRSDVLSIKREVSITERRSVLVSFGGTDPALLTYPVVARLLEISSIEVVVALPDEHPDFGAIEELIVQHPTRLYPDSGDLSDGYRSADIAIVGGGSTLWEVAFLGIPAVAVIVANNQVEGTLEAEREGFLISVDARARNAGHASDVISPVQALLADADQRQRMSELGRALFDGSGTNRVVAEIEACVERYQRSVL